MEPYPYSCDTIRQDTLGMLKFLEPGYDNIMARENYFERVDDVSRTNCYCDLIKNETRKYKKLFNPKWWRPINAQTNVQSLIEDWGYDWPKKSKIEAIFRSIDEEFQQKGLEPCVRRPLNREPPPKKEAPKRVEEQEEATSELSTQESMVLNDPRLKNIDRKIAERILNEIVSQKTAVTWDDIAGLDNVKQAINEIVVYPMLNPSLFQGLLAPAKGLLLFGPPGTGKTLIGKCIACESGATFFAISASSLTSKWIGEGEKMVRALFAVARCMQPSVVFIDEIDSLLTQRVDGEHDSSRRMKTEFLVQFDGVSTAADDRLLIVGATNRPQELDEAARRRFTKRIYIPLPNEAARRQIIENLMKKQKNNLTDECLDYVARRAEGFSGADMSGLCKEAAMIVVRSVLRSGVKKAQELSQNDLPPISKNDFEIALKAVKASVSGSDMSTYEIWDKKYGAARDMSDLSSQS
uniref:Fidgetin-like protein 1 n=1 Tax=Aceria tosichella TaxID=561515 RepID=A0A6G1SJS9_9ACAR